MQLSWFLSQEEECNNVQPTAAQREPCRIELYERRNYYCFIAHFLGFSITAKSFNPDSCRLRHVIVLYHSVVGLANQRT
jgi:hypothetical protein